MYRIKINVNQQVFSATLYDSETVRAIIEQLPMTLDMKDLHDNEKYAYVSKRLPTKEQPFQQLHTGDLMLFGNDCMVVFYKDFTTSYSYTPLGKVEDTRGLVEALGDGNVRIVLSMQ